eukprot:sb/3471228/
MVGGAMANYEEKTVIGETIGISLEKEGFLLDRNGKHYRSPFLKEPNPITGSEVCQGLCGNIYKFVETRAKGRVLDCPTTYFCSIGNVINSITLTTDHVATQCIQSCLRHPDCMQASVQDQTCILQSRGLKRSELEDGASTDAEFNLQIEFGVIYGVRIREARQGLHLRGNYSRRHGARASVGSTPRKW